MFDVSKPSYDIPFQNVIIRHRWADDDFHLYYDIYEDGEQCTHRGCSSHVSHPCELCGRTAARGRVLITNDMLYLHNYFKHNDEEKEEE